MKLNDQQLSDFSKDHLCYELNQLCSGVYTLGQYKKVPADGFNVALENTLAESIILHARCLYEFLYHSENNRFTDDARASHYFDDADSWGKLRPEFSDEIKNLWARAGKEIVHLTYGRRLLTETTKIWKLNTIANEILAAIDTFARNADTAKLHEDVLKTVRHWQKLVVYSPTGVGLGAASGATMTTGLFHVDGEG
jgi:hypothetical protein